MAKYWGFANPHKDDRPLGERGYTEINPNDPLPATAACNLRKVDVPADARDPLQDLHEMPDKIPGTPAQKPGKV